MRAIDYSYLVLTYCGRDAICHAFHMTILIPTPRKLAEMENQIAQIIADLDRCGERLS